MNRIRMNMISVAVLLCPALSAGQTAFGHWTEDGNGLPAYHYTGALPFAAADEYGSGLTLDRPALQKVTEAVVAVQPCRTDSVRSRER